MLRVRGVRNSNARVRESYREHPPVAKDRVLVQGELVYQRIGCFFLPKRNKPHRHPNATDNFLVLRVVGLSEE